MRLVQVDSDVVETAETVNTRVLEKLDVRTEAHAAALCDVVRSQTCSQMHRPVCCY